MLCQKTVDKKKHVGCRGMYLYTMSLYIRSGMHGRDRKSAETNKNMSDIAKIVIARVVITGVHCK